MQLYIGFGNSDFETRVDALVALPFEYNQ